MRKWKITSDDADNNNYQWQKTDEQQQQQLVINSTSTLSKEGGIDNICSFSNSLFVTGSGKRVTISQNNLVKAKTLLGLNEDVDVSNTQTLQHAKKWHAVGETYERQSSPHLQLHKSVNNNRAMNAASCQNHSLGSSHTSKNDFQIEVGQTNMCTSGGKQPQTIFHTAGGRSIFVSNDALQRARSLLGDLDLGDFLDGGDVSDSIFSLPNQKQINTSSSCDRSDCDNPLVDQVTSDNNLMTKCFMSPLSSCRQKDTRFLCEGPANNLIQKFDAVGNENDKSLKSSITCEQKPLQLPDSTAYHSPLNGFSSKVDPLRMSSGRSLSGISNTNNNVHTNNRKQPASGKRRVGQYVMVSPFKKPRASKTSIPSNNNVGVFSNGFSQFSGDASVSKIKVSTLYPFRHPRMHIKHFFVAPSIDQKVHFTNLVRQMTSGNAEKYVFHEGYGEGGIGAEAFVNLLVQHGASMHFASKEWVLNHYKWIVWKLACYVRCCSARSAGNFLTVSNVLEELKYRYEREVNHGHRSTLKKILEGDALPSSMMVLCISSIHSNHGLENGTHSSESVTVELTDGWYSINAMLDVPLSKQLACGKLFVGQKLRIWGAGLCGWNGPVSPLEVSSAVSLMLHINGTYRAHWADRLGFCKVSGPPLAFRCIKSNGGLIPQTLVGVTRIYPILYKERLSCGRSVVISERMENKMMELYNQRYSAAVEGIISDYQKERRCSCVDESDSEAAKIYEMLETAEDPEFLMADMSLEQLKSFAKYKEKMDGRLTSHPERRCSCVEESDSEAAKIYEMLEAAEDPEFLMADMSLEQLKSFAKYKEKMDGRLTSHPERRCLCVDESDSEAAKIYEMLEAAEDPEFLMADMSLEQLKSFAHYEKKINAIEHSEKEKTIEKALKDAGLRNREVTPFMRLRVVGLTHKTRQDRPKDGIVTIWNPTDKQRQELVEGEAYAVAGLMPSDVDLDILHLQSRGSSTKWLPLSSNAKEQFKPFFSNRKSTSMSSLSYIPLSSEFDIAAHVVHVGEVYISSQQKKQWIFVTDGSIMHGLQSKTISLLAICFCSPSIDYDSFPPINYDLAGATVGFCNLIKREKDQTNHVWVADATENSTYCLSYESPHYAHLRNTASSIRRWANNSSLTIEMLKEKVLSMVGDFKE